MRHVSIPKERVGVLIGPEGRVKTWIERTHGCRIHIQSETGDVMVDDSEGSLGGLRAVEMVKAIGRGFAPEKAFKLARDDYYLHVFDIRDYVGKHQKRVQLMRGRVIGTGGKMRTAIEKSTGVHVSVQGNTVAILGELESLEVAKRAVDMLLSGSEHSAVNRFLDKSRIRMAMDQLYSYSDAEDEE